MYTNYRNVHVDIYLIYSNIRECRCLNQFTKVIMFCFLLFHVCLLLFQPIPSNTELKVWYSADYAQSIGKGMLPSEDKFKNDGKTFLAFNSLPKDSKGMGGNG